MYPGSTEDDAIRFTRHKTGTLKPATGPAQQKKKKQMFEIKVHFLEGIFEESNGLIDLHEKGGQNAFSMNNKSTGKGTPGESFGERLNKASSNAGKGPMSRGKYGNVSMTYDSSSQRGKKKTRGGPSRR